MDAVDLEYRMRIAEDTKKQFLRNKSEGKWYWYNKGDMDTLQGGFDTFWDALSDAVAPYLEEEDDVPFDPGLFTFRE